jgi:hypothetical protein
MACFSISRVEPSDSATTVLVIIITVVLIFSCLTSCAEQHSRIMGLVPRLYNILGTPNEAAITNKGKR